MIYIDQNAFNWFCRDHVLQEKAVTFMRTIMNQLITIGIQVHLVDQIGVSSVCIKGKNCIF